MAISPRGVDAVDANKILNPIECYLVDGASGEGRVVKCYGIEMSGSIIRAGTVNYLAVATRKLTGDDT